MKKYLGFVFVFMILCSFVQPVLADDGGPNTDFWVIDHKTNCISFMNPEVVGKDAFLVFDYSANTGAALGKPWAIVEKGTCYQTDDGTEELYKINTIQGNEKQIFSNYSLYKPTDSVKDIFCKDSYCTNTTLGHKIDIGNLLGESPVTATQQQVVHFTGIDTNALFSTKYDIGYPITSFSSGISDDILKITKNSSFVALRDLSTTLAKELNSTLIACDSRIRTENQDTIILDEQGNIFPDTRNVIWRLANNKDTVVQTYDSTIGLYGFPKGLTKPDPFKEIELMGCKDAYRNFIQQHQTDFTKIDQLAEEIIAKYPDALQTKDDDPRPIVIRGPVIDQDVELTPYTSDETSNQTITTGIVTSTDLDGPTKEIRSNIFLHATSLFMKIYVWLPLLSLFGLLLFLIRQKKK